MPEPLLSNQVLDRCGSTNDLARKLGEQGAPHGSWISARIQESGRGRLGREWQSLQGNLFISIVVRIEAKSRWTWVPLASAVGVMRCLREIAVSEAPHLRIKWPNDLWVMRGGVGHKLGGVLCEAVGNLDGSFLIVGLGLNCAHAPQGIDQPAASLSEIFKREVTADEIRLRVVESVLGAIDELSLPDGTSAIARDYERQAAFPVGTQIEWQPGSGASVVGKVVSLGASSELKVIGENGDLISLFAEDVKVRSR